MRTLFFVLLSIVITITEASAQGWSHETEAGIDGKGSWSVTPIVFFETGSCFVLSRVKTAADLVRFDISIGPVVRVKTYKLQPYAGADTQGHLVLGALLSSTAGNGWYYFAESRGFRKDQTTLFHRLSATVDKDGSWQLRLEAVQAGTHLTSLSPGVALDIKVHKKVKVVLAPYFDLVSRTGGLNFGFKVD